jgi:Family of unknown function (DUF5995)
VSSKRVSATAPALGQILEARPARRIVEVTARLRGIVSALPPGDGLRAFSTLYLAVTEAVAETARPGAYEDVRFVRWLDVVFANIYFDALRAFAGGTGPVPKAWAPLIDAPTRRGILPLQFALAGMNAHINRDLPLALVATCEQRGIELKRRSPQRRDYRRINVLLARTEKRVKAELVTGIAGDVDVALGQVDDVVAMWNVERAREAAWAQAETLWALRDLPRLRSQLLHSQDRLVGFAGRGLLRPLGA